ncbi:MAG: lysoplasmalogenase family protein, partial [Mycobacterium leprae]
MMPLLLSVAILISGLLFLVGATYKVRWLQYILKPGTMLLIMLLAFTGRAHSPAPLFADLMLVALGCSVVGDVLLMLEPPRFQGGVVAFMGAHVAYMAAFAAAGAAHLTPAHAVIALVVASVLLRYCLEMAPAIRESGHGRLLGGVLLYACVSTLMLWLALGSLVAPGPLPFR